MKYFDNTRVSAYRSCARYFYYRHVRNWRPQQISVELANGAAWHAGMDEIWKNFKRLADEELVMLAIHAWRKKMLEEGIPIDDPTYAFDQKQTEGVAKEMFRNYITKRKAVLSDLELLAVEQPFAVPLGPSADVFYVGRWDKVVRDRHKRIHAIEHKTTSAYKKDGYFRTDWLTSFSPNSQIDGYLYAGYLVFGEDFKSVWVDGALVHKTVHDGFTFIPISKTTTMLDLWLWETTRWIKMIKEELEMYALEDPESPIMRVFPRNTDKCSMYRGCVYKDICRFYPNPMQIEDPPEGFVEDRWEPFSELQLDKIGLIQEGDSNG